MNESLDRRDWWGALGRWCALALLSAGGALLVRRNATTDCSSLPCAACDQRRDCNKPQRTAKEAKR